MKMKYINIIIFILVLFLLFFSTYNQRVTYKDFGDPFSPIRICFIAGVHGNEPAASLHLCSLLKTDYFDRMSQRGIFIRVIPRVNEFGLDMGIRYQNSLFHPDINRTFGEEGENDVISKDMIKLTRDMTLIVDFHEGWGFHLLDDKSLGSTLTVTNDVKSLGQKIIERINETISDPFRKFVILDRMCKIKEAFSCYNNVRGRNYILVETSGQNNIQDLNIRQDQIQIVIETCLEI